MYKPTAWSISTYAMVVLLKIIEDANLTRILEFGSGRSTDLLAYLFEITSFDDNPKYASKHALIRPLRKDGFYNVKEGDITGEYDLIILDGPNGPHRGLAYDIIEPHIPEHGAVIFIDDSEQFDFVQKILNKFVCSMIFVGKEKHKEYMILQIRRKN